MLFYLSLCAHRGVRVLAYRDPSGTLCFLASSCSVPIGCEPPVISLPEARV